MESPIDPEKTPSRPARNLITGESGWFKDLSNLECFMDETRGRGRGRTPWGLVGMLGLIVAAESVFASHALELTGDAGRLAWRVTGRAAGGEAARRSDVLCFGDSLVKLGMPTRVLEDSVGRPAFNLALAAGRAPMTYLLLRRALDAGAEPKVVVVDFHSTLLHAPPRIVVDHWAELLTPRELVEISWATCDVESFGRTLLALTLASVKNRWAIRDGVCAALAGRSRPEPVLFAALLRNWRVNRGAQVGPPRSGSAAPGAADAPPNDSATAGPQPPWAPHWANAVFVKKFLDLAAARGLRVVWLLPPTSPAFQAACERTGESAGYTKFVRETQARYPYVVVSGGRIRGRTQESSTLVVASGMSG